MGPLDHLAMGLLAALQPANLLYCFLGVFFGTLVGVLPGIGPPGVLALLPWPPAWSACTPDAVARPDEKAWLQALSGGMVAFYLEK